MLKKKTNNKELLYDGVYVTLAIFLSLIARFLYPYSSYLKREFQFPDTSIPFFYSADSFHYWKVLTGMGYTETEMIVYISMFIAITILFFYFLLRLFKIRPLYSFLGTLMFSTLPLYYSYTILNYVDTQQLIMPLFMFIVICTVLLFRSTVRLEAIVYSACIFASFLSLAFFWSGWLLLLGLYLMTIILILPSKQWWSKALVLIILFVAVVLTSSTTIINLFKYKVLGVAEYQLPQTVIFYYIVFFVLFFLALNWYHRYDKSASLRFLSSSFWLFIIATFFIGRVALFASVFLMFLAIYFSHGILYKHKFVLAGLYLFFILANATLIIATTYDHNYVMTNEYRESLESLDDRPILAYWDNGHYISAYTDNDDRK
jgi:hypothetical protein